MFQTNQRVACVNADIPPRLWEFVKPLVKDAIYTIRAIVPGTKDGRTHDVAVYLHEILNTVNEHGIERGYAHERFAPLQEDTEDVSLWETAPQEELVPA
jgi:hypothetical protein